MICYTICRISEFEITIVEKEGKIIQASFGSCGMPEWTEKKTNLLAEAERQLREYFCGERREFQLPLVPEGTAFQQKVWKALQTIPYGETRSYKEIAIQAGNEKACRAVGMANHRNPIGIFIPWGRGIGSGGELTGYAGGLDKKKFLLELESGGNRNWAMRQLF